MYHLNMLPEENDYKYVYRCPNCQRFVEYDIRIPVCPVCDGHMPTELNITDFRKAFDEMIDEVLLRR
jgi:rRNA maturation endonuclease Nob1